jgi:hypothetical protein
MNEEHIIVNIVKTTHNSAVTRLLCLVMVMIAKSEMTTATPPIK